MKKRYELKQLLFSLSIVLSLIGVVIICLFIFMFFRNRAMDEEVIEKLERITTKYTEIFESSNTENIEYINSIASFINPEDSLDEIKDFLANEIKRDIFSKIIYVRTDLTGVSVDANGFSKDYSYKKHLDYFEKIFTENQTVYNVFVDDITQEGTICYATPVYDKENVIGAVLAIDNLEEYKNIVKRLNSLDETNIIIIDRDGKIVIDASEDENNGKQIEDLYNLEELNLEVQDFISLDNHIVSRSLRIHNDYYITSHVIDDNNMWYALSMVKLSDYKTSLKPITMFTLGIIIFITLLFLCMSVYMLKVIQKSNKRMNRMAFYNSVTGVINKNGFMEKLPELYLNKILYSFVALDIHDFKFINYSFGYQIGNKLLRHIADVLKEELHEDECFYHRESDKFGILLHTQESSKIAKRVEEIMNKISDFDLLPQQRYPINCHCGIILFDTFSYDSDINLMIDRAYIAKKKIKDLHGNQYAFYDDVMYREAEKKNDIEKRMKDGIVNKEFKLYIQPKYDLVNETICSGEVLVRWVNKDGKITLPTDFIPIFEQNGFISKLDLYMLEETCRFQSMMRKQGMDIFPLSINQSRILLFEENYINNVSNLLKKYAIEPGDIIIEITESIPADTFNEIKTIISKLHNLGIKVSIDDFGSGYSSLNILKELTIDELKLDKEFLSNIKDAVKCEIIIESIITMAKKCNIQVVCEGVETKEHVEMLQEKNCDIAQGYYYSKPISEAEFKEQVYGLSEA
ncbi:bifunctional diguanylate cyclase/phosphodiesterase [Clostridium sp. Marseille-P299]|uniref:bifunctional diguanylate cyclase/phosphodiesterase n=1 Tax=Clostridium sp. Marseille-P299 TaxID=1805477 RepID=UPI00082E705F|nr:EAL domain-containing protein [Clostridium sp. Marseille-P299]